MKDDAVYTPSDCFLTFPLPEGWRDSDALLRLGRTYYDVRASLMAGSGVGLTTTYGRFHDPNEHDAAILELRDLHATMDRAVLDSYGWSDLPIDCEFLLDYELDEGETSGSKKPWRYRLRDEIRDEVLARLLELNEVRAMDEARAGGTTRPSGARGAVTSTLHQHATDTLF